MYASARAGSSAWRSNTGSADSELASSLEALRNRSRELMRDAPHAKRIRSVVVQNVIGTGVKFQAKIKNVRGEFRKPLNDALEVAFARWSRPGFCHTGGELSFAAIERLAFAEIVEAGEIFLRVHRLAFGGSDIPIAIEVIEAERLADRVLASDQTPANHVIKHGIERDGFNRPAAYFFKPHPGNLSGYTDPGKLERVPASDVFHLRIMHRYPQGRGEPWLHAVARKLDDVDGYTEAEIRAARAGASYMGFITRPDPTNAPEGVETDDAGNRTKELSPGSIEELAPGEEFNGYSPNRPNSNAESFLRFMLREAAAGTGISYESLSRDYSQSNYSSSRLALIDDREEFRALQRWWIQTFREPFYRIWIQQAALSGAVAGLDLDAYAMDMERYCEAVFRPRGWGWIDPTKEVAAYKEAVLSGFMTVSDVVAQTAGGRDLEEVLQERRAELDAMAALGLEFDTSPGASKPAPPPAPAAPGDDENEPPADDDDETNGGARARLVSLGG